jgi:hypothetical protein
VHARCRTLKALSVPEFLTLVQSAQEVWTASGNPPAWMNDTQVFWLPQQHQVCCLCDAKTTGSLFAQSNSPSASATLQFMLVAFTRADAANETDAAQALSGGCLVEAAAALQLPR